MTSKILGIIIVIALIAGLVIVSVNNKGGKKTRGRSDFKTVERLIVEGKLDEAKSRVDDIAKKKPEANLLGKVYFHLGLAYEKKNQLVRSRDLYEKVLNRYQNVDNIMEVQDRLGDLNIKILFSPLVTTKDVSYTVNPGDTLSKIAKEFKTTVDLLKTSNGLKDHIIRVNQKLKVAKVNYKIFIDKSQNIMTVLWDKGAVFKVYHVATGANNSTPVGTFKIVNRIKDPVWYTQGAIVPAESPDNILGTRWLGFSEPGYGIHGTVDPDSVGQQATKGCIRMLNHEVEELYTMIPVGTEVTIVD